MRIARVSPVGIFAATWLVTSAVWAAQTFTFEAPRPVGRTDHVVVRLEVGGEIEYLEKGKAQHDKMSVDCSLDYVERTVEAPGEAAGTLRSVREYRTAAAEVKVGDGGVKPTLRPEHRLIVAEVGPKSAMLFSPADNLTREELDAIDVPVNSLLLDRLLPDQPVAVDATWTHAKSIMGSLLNLESVDKSNVESTLKEVTREVVRFELAGRVEGTVNGVKTALDLRGKYRFDRRTKRIDWLGMLVKEKREISRIEEGLDVVSRLQITVTPADPPESLAQASTSASTPESLELVYESPDGAWRCLHDRRWYVYHKRAKSSYAVLLMVDGGEQLAQCNVSSLPQRSPDKAVSFEKFQEDVRQALGESFGQLVEAGQSANAANCRVFRVAVDGAASEIPMRWVYYLVTDSQGRQAALRFAVEQKLLERFDAADKAMLQSLQFLDKAVQPKDEKAAETSSGR